MKAGRVVQVVLLILVILYLVLFHSANHEVVELPLFRLFLPQLPVSYVIAFSIVVAFLVGWAPARLKAYRRGREIKRLRKRLEELEPTPVTSHLGEVPLHHGEVPIIPDRGGSHSAADTDDLEAG